MEPIWAVPGLFFREIENVLFEKSLKSQSLQFPILNCVAVWQFNETLTKALIMRQICSPIKTSVFDIALCTTAKEFICHIGFQACVEEFWTNHLNYSLLRVLFDIFLPFWAVRDMRKAEEAKRDIWAPKSRKGALENFS